MLGGFVNSAALSEIVPILPLYINHLGVHNTQQVEILTGLAFGCTTLVAALFTPLWGNLADKYGRRPMMLRSSLGIALTLILTGYVCNIYQLLGARFIMGIVAGFNATAVTLIATQVPQDKAGWALGTLNTGMIGGMLFGPVIGGYLIEVTSFTTLFTLMGLCVAIAFFLTLFFIKENFTPPSKKLASFTTLWKSFPHKSIVVTMFLSSFFTQAALFSIEPIITIYIHMLSPNTSHLAFISGIIFASAGFSSFLTSPYLGRIADRIGPYRVFLVGIIASAICFIPQAFVQNEWQLMFFRLLTGIAFGSIYPTLNAVLKRFTPPETAGRIFSYMQSGQFLGVFAGSVLGGQLSATFGIPHMFLITSALLFLNALLVYNFIYKPINLHERLGKKI